MAGLFTAKSIKKMPVIIDSKYAPESPKYINPNKFNNNKVVKTGIKNFIN